MTLAVALARFLSKSNSGFRDRWREKWETEAPADCIDEKPVYYLTRRHWITMDRIRTNHGRCADLLFEW